jgi:hypothetical protein
VSLTLAVQLAVLLAAIAIGARTGGVGVACGDSRAARPPLPGLTVSVDIGGLYVSTYQGVVAQG